MFEVIRSEDPLIQVGWFAQSVTVQECVGGEYWETRPFFKLVDGEIHRIGLRQYVAEDVDFEIAPAMVSGLVYNYR